ncbi:YihA family ribosome biogenesis GTP-binding protein [Helicobacter anseris]|uniref:Probable GTP-binding protein EngB n=1 Tax=Helicobacter anseris TaxID=375926 RepID=A0A3D8J708_9HELI|nr:ribosome biogenesis GTP-binding protein YihA/YsxC [Helicobacter anseris]RDU73212.1 YihA family ribosome biogenesis GTP-binding protein [Helicobacter anseris]
MIEVKKSCFITSAKDLSSCPSIGVTEIALLGRSNVGKSTFINLILNHSKLAKSSSTPGKTQLINFFETIWHKEGQNFNLCFVDLPGFGYAKVSKTLKEEWEANLWDFLQFRTSIKLFIHLIDSRHQNLDIDKKVFEILQANCRADQDILKIYTKCDKITSNQRGLLEQKKALMLSVDDKIFKKNYNAKERIRQMILNRVLGNDNL